MNKWINQPHLFLDLARKLFVIRELLNSSMSLTSIRHGFLSIIFATKQDNGYLVFYPLSSCCKSLLLLCFKLFFSVLVQHYLNIVWPFCSAVCCYVVFWVACFCFVSHSTLSLINAILKKRIIIVNLSYNSFPSLLDWSRTWTASGRPKKKKKQVANSQSMGSVGTSSIIKVSHSSSSAESGPGCLQRS